MDFNRFQELVYIELILRIFMFIFSTNRNNFLEQLYVFMEIIKSTRKSFHNEDSFSCDLAHNMKGFCCRKLGIQKKKIVKSVTGKVCT